MTDEAPKKGRVIRNPTLDEIEQIRKAKTAEGLTETEAAEQEVVEESPAVAKKVETKPTKTGQIKPKTSIFEPDPYPFKLPSGSLFVQLPNNEIYVRRMGAAEESLFFQLLSNNNTRSINNTMDATIANCCKSDIDIYELSLVDKLPVFFKIIDLTYGPIDVTFKCEECQKEHGKKINLLKDLKYNHIPTGIKYPHKIRLTSFPGAKIDWYVNYPTIKQSSDYMDSSNIVDVLRMLTVKLEGTITANGEEHEINEHDYEDIFKNMNDIDLEEFKKFENEFGSYSVDLVVEHACDDSTCSRRGVKVSSDLPIEFILDRIIRLQNRK